MTMRLLVLLCLLFSGVFGNAQPPGAEIVFRERFSLLRQNSFQEKVYLHTDRSHYVAGEYIWFRAFRTDAATHQPALYSRFVYVELYDARDRLVNRIKVMERDGVFAGSFPLDPYLPAGRYTLRAYTYWMQNFDEAFYFRKEIWVENSRFGKVQREVVWDTTAEGDWQLSVRFIPEGREDYSRLFVDCRQYYGKKEVKRSVNRPGEQGWFQLYLRAKDSVTTICFQFLDKNPFEYRWNLQVPVKATPKAVDIRFFPEGGDWFENISSRVGFKAVGPDGYGVEVSGEIFRDDHVPMTSFVSVHRGMGQFTLCPEAGRSYYAEVRLPGGGVKRVELPPVREKGVALQVETMEGMMRYTCLSTPGFLRERQLYLLVHTRGILMSVMPVEEGCCGYLPLQALRGGIVHGALVDDAGQVYSSRLSFVYPPEKDTLLMSVDRAAIGKRDSVFLSLNWLGIEGLGCSLAVTDSVLAVGKRWESNIVNYFLLDSDLRGYIEDPGWYFDAAIPLIHRWRMLDILLMTQGWQRFDVGRVCRNEWKPLPFFLELTQGFSGRLCNFWGKNARNPRLFAIVPRLKMIKEVPVDSLSRFDMYVEYPDSTEFIFQAYTRRGRKWVEIQFREDSLREVKVPLMPPWVLRPEERDTLQYGFREVKTLGYYYAEGRKIYRLEEAVVVKKNFKPGGLIPHKVWEARDIEEEKFKTVLQWVATIPGVHIENVRGYRKIVYGHLESKPRKVNIAVEGVPDGGMLADMVDLLGNIPIAYIERLAYTTEVSDTVMNIYVQLKKGTDFTLRGRDFYRFTPLGYHKPAEFYVPRYEVEEERLNPEPDERPTLYWNPDVRLQKGRTETFRFFTTDREGPFTVTVEGITPEGKVVRSVLNIKNNR